jgi:hypothetical protein
MAETLLGGPQPVGDCLLVHTEGRRSGGGVVPGGKVGGESLADPKGGGGVVAERAQLALDEAARLLLIRPRRRRSG